MTPKQKAIELLSQMPEPFKTWALENLDKQQFELIVSPKNIADAIDNCFIWSVSHEGWKFWESVKRHYQYGSPLPELPLECRCKQFVKENEELKKKVEKLESDIELFGQLNTKTK